MSTKKKTSRHPRDLRLDDIELLITQGLNEPYLNPATRHNKMMRFNIGSPVVTPQHGVFYSARIRKYDSMTVPESLYPSSPDLPMEDRVPTYFIHYDGWPDKDEFTVPENELFTAMFPGRPVDTLALLFAHECNLVKRDKEGIRDEQLGRGAFLMNDELYRTLEASWRSESGEILSFAEYCGRKPGPFFSSLPILKKQKRVAKQEKK